MIINSNFSSPNFTERTKSIDYIIIHFTEMNFEEALFRLTDREAEVSAHYLIKEDGAIFRLVDDDKIAWHAGKSYWKGETALNKNSIGIELDNSGYDKFPEAQINSCLRLCKLLQKKYNIPIENFIGHSDVAPSRKIDPGIFFDWKFFAARGLGIWHNVIELTGSVVHRFGGEHKSLKKLQQNLAKIGYEININGRFDRQTNYVVRSFQSKFYPDVIHKKGIEFYRHPNSEYSWCTVSEEILSKLLTSPFEL